MKSLLVSIRPKWVEKICHEIGKDENGKPIYEKRIEVRKSAPKEVPFKAYIYCTKGKDGYEWLYRVDNNGYGKAQSWHGKVIGEFICDKITKFTYDGYGSYSLPLFLQKAICLDGMELYDYLRGKDGYGWHISDLRIYDKPILLEELGADKAPQSWQYVEELTND